ncbi:MAG: hypothetical protein UV38_C0002G0129 [candidate division TM6 bacterium GW2011_GWE2_42_60]|nr:MAG: hypothetical protein UV38_C0002G0129 [candidate division TM6 bacterium GW2011_GWE2_42_60]HBY06114.1 hypothetical protein [Candidatus Dependentiae bacterium]
MKKYFLLLLPSVLLLAEVDIYGMQNSNNSVVPNGLEGNTLPSFAELLQSLNNNNATATTNTHFVGKQGEQPLQQNNQVSSQGNNKNLQQRAKNPGEFIPPINNQLPTNISEQPLQKKRNITFPKNNNNVPIIPTTTTTTTNTPFVEEQGGASSSSSTSMPNGLLSILDSDSSVCLKLKQQALKKLFDGAGDSANKLNEIATVFNKRKKASYLLNLFINPVSESEDSVLKHIITKEDRVGSVQLRFILNFLIAGINRLASADRDKIKYFKELAEYLEESPENITPLSLKLIHNVKKIMNDGFSAGFQAEQVSSIINGWEIFFETQTDFLLPQNQQLLVPSLTTQSQPTTSTSASASSNSSKKISDWWAKDGKSLIWDQKEWAQLSKNGARKHFFSELLADAGKSTEMLDAIKEVFGQHVPHPKVLFKLIFEPKEKSNFSVFQDILNKNIETGVLHLKFILGFLNTRIHSSQKWQQQIKNYDILSGQLEYYAKNLIASDSLNLITKIKNGINAIRGLSSDEEDQSEDIFKKLQALTTITVVRPLIINTAIHSLKKKRNITPQNNNNVTTTTTTTTNTPFIEEQGGASSSHYILNKPLPLQQNNTVPPQENNKVMSSLQYSLVESIQQSARTQGEKRKRFIPPINNKNKIREKWNIISSKDNNNVTTPNATTTTNTPFVEEQGGASSSSLSFMSDEDLLALENDNNVCLKLKQQALKKLFDGAGDSANKLNDIVAELDKRIRVPCLLNLFIKPISESEDSVLRNIINKKNRVGSVQLRFVLRFLLTKIDTLSFVNSHKIKYFKELSKYLEESTENITPLNLNLIHNVKKIINDGFSARYKTSQVLNIVKGLENFFEKQTNSLLPTVQPRIFTSPTIMSSKSLITATSSLNIPPQLPAPVIQSQITTTVGRVMPLRPLFINTAIRSFQKKPKPQN